jgi:DNA-binding response OmpR family regulator
MVDVVVLNHDQEVLEALAEAVEVAGFSVATRHAVGPVEELAAFIRRHDPGAVVYDLGPPPVESSLQKWRTLCRLPGAGRAYVITTSFPVKLELEGCMVDSVLLKPLGFDAVGAAVRRALHR